MSSKGFEALNAGVEAATEKVREALRHVPDGMRKGEAEIRDKAELPPLVDIASSILIAYALANSANVCEISEVDDGGIRFTFRVTCEVVDAKPANHKKED